MTMERSVDETIKYLHEKGIRYLYQGQQDDDVELIKRGSQYIEFSLELKERIRLCGM